MKATLVMPLFLVCIWFAAGADEPAQPQPRPPQVDFARDVQPMLEAKCNRCHGAKKRGGGVDLRTREAMLKGGVTGPALEPGNAEKSLMVELIHFNEMPPKKDGARVTKEELKLLRAWIDAGAPVKQSK